MGFLPVDFLFFHDIFKAGEATSLPQYMTGFLSILVFAICGQSLLKSERRLPSGSAWTQHAPTELHSRRSATGVAGRGAFANWRSQRV